MVARGLASVPENTSDQILWQLRKDTRSKDARRAGVVGVCATEQSGGWVGTNARADGTGRNSSLR